MADPKTPLEPGETVVKEGMANLMRGAEAVGGRLHLTDRRLIFESHDLNIQTGPAIIALDEIEGVEKATTKLFGVLPIMPNSILVVTTGARHAMVVNGRKGWIAAIDAQRTA